MELTALLLSRLQFAFTISFHIIFPAFSIGIAAWLTVLEAMYLLTGRPAYRGVFEFWLKIFAVVFGLGVVTGIVMAFQFGMNWSEMARTTGSIQGVLLSYETFTAFALEASFFGVLLFGRSRVRPWFYLFSTAMVSLGTSLSAFWIMANNSWMQVPIGYTMENGVAVPTDWIKIIFNPVLWVRFPHMLLAAYVTGAFCVAATGAWYLLRREYHTEAHIMLRMGLGLAAVLMPVQLFFGHLNDEYVVHHQPSKMAAIEARWHDEKPYMVLLIFMSAFGTLAISFWPYMIPFVITIDEAAALHSSLAFMFWGEGLFVFPLMLIYTAVSYHVFRGKIGPAAQLY
jgi:cytochrome bd ubiquinol oxidase subunit I